MFLQTDPIGYKDNLDLYEYVGNDPVDFTDPTGTEVANLGFGVLGALPILIGDSEEVGLAVQFGKQGFNVGLYRSYSNSWRGLMIQGGPSLGFQPGTIDGMNGTGKYTTGALGIGFMHASGNDNLSSDFSIGKSKIEMPRNYNAHGLRTGGEGLAIGYAKGNVTTKAATAGEMLRGAAQALGFDSAKQNKDGTITFSRTKTGSRIEEKVTCGKDGKCH